MRLCIMVWSSCWCFCYALYRLNSISLTQPARPLLRLFPVQTRYVLMLFKLRQVDALLRLISAAILFSMGMEAGLLVIMFLIQCILTRSSSDSLWLLTLHPPSFLGESLCFCRLGTYKGSEEPSFFGEDYVSSFISSKHCNIIILWIKLTVTA